MNWRPFAQKVMFRSCAFALLLASVPWFATARAGELSVGETACGYAVNPLGIDDGHPQLSWRLESTARAQMQGAYQIQVSSRPEFSVSHPADLWDTGKVLSSQSTQVPYAGLPLRSRERCYWRVRVWDKHGAPSDFSPVANWEMGLLAPGDWQAAWIGYTAGWPGRALYFRHAFEVKKPVLSARAYISGLGYYELRLNGAKVGDHVLDPGWTDYAKRVLYVTYDLGTNLRLGANMVAVVAGQGWYGSPRVLLQIELTYADGTRECIASEGGSTHAPQVWQVSGGPITRNAIYDGETYDARREKAGWDLADAPKAAGPADRLEEWATAVEVEAPGGRLVAQTLEPIRIVGSFAPQRLSQPRPGIYVFDAGHNLAGWAELRVAGPRGTQVTLRFAENLSADGTVNQDNLRTAAATDEYILKGGGEEVWEPRFTYHGFRYVQMEGAPRPPSRDSLRIKAVRSDVAVNGTFACGDELLNRIQGMVQATEASNLHSVPTDCPQRNERMGWLNDMTVRAEEAIYNFTLPRFYGKWIDDIADTQDAAGAIADTAPFKWGKRPADPVCASYFLLAWLSYYGDVGLIREHYASFGHWVEYLVAHSDHGIVPFSSWGDWSPPQAFAIAGSSGSGAVSAGTPGDLMSTGSLYYQVRLLTRMAGVLGREEDVRRWQALSDRIGRAFDRKYWNETAGGYGSNNQACNSFALYIGLVAPERRARVVANLVADVARNGGHLTTGNLCTKFLLETLAQNGRMDVAYRIAAMRTYPSWGYMLDNGATTLWERWENLTGGGMNSHNHPMMGSVSSWLFKYLGGIQADQTAPGFRHFTLRPGIVPAVGWTEASYRSPYGRIRSAWRLDGKKMTLEDSIPVNSSATVYVPGGASGEVWESGRRAATSPGVQSRGTENGAGRFEVGSGDYVFVAVPKA